MSHQYSFYQLIKYLKNGSAEVYEVPPCILCDSFEQNDFVLCAKCKFFLFKMKITLFKKFISPLGKHKLKCLFCDKWEAKADDYKQHLTSHNIRPHYAAIIKNLVVCGIKRFFYKHMVSHPFYFRVYIGEISPGPTRALMRETPSEVLPEYAFNRRPTVVEQEEVPPETTGPQTKTVYEIVREEAMAQKLNGD